MSDRILLTPTLLPIELNEQSNDIYMTLKMIILTSNVNLNGAKFTEDFIDGIIENQEKYIGIGLVVDRDKLETEQFDSLSHNFDGESLKTEMIGSFIGFEKMDNGDGSYSLVGESRVLKRFPKTCEAIVQLASENKLRFSCEALVSEYGEVGEGFREIPYAEGKNKLIANCVVSDPAEVKAKPTLLVASLDEDLNLVESDKNSDLNIHSNINGGGTMALSVADMRKQMNEFMSKVAIKMRAKKKIQEMTDAMAELNEVDDQMVDNMIELMGSDFSSGSWVDFWVTENCVFDNHFICQDWYSGKLFMMDYSVNEEAVVCSNPRLAKIEYVEVAEKIMIEMSQMMAEIYKQHRETSSTLSQKEEEITTLNTEKETLTNEINTLKNDIQVKDNALQLNEQSANEKIIKLGEVVDELKGKLEEVQPLIEERNVMIQEKQAEELAQKKEELKQFALASKRITEQEIVENVEIAAAIENLDKGKIVNIIAERVVADEIKNTTTTSTQTDDVTIVVNSQGEDLLPTTVLSKYGFSN